MTVCQSMSRPCMASSIHSDGKRISWTELRSATTRAQAPGRSTQKAPEMLLQKCEPQFQLLHSAIKGHDLPQTCVTGALQHAP